MRPFHHLSFSVAASFSSAEPETLQVCSDAIKKLTTSIDMEEFMPHLDFIYNNMRSIISDAKFR